MDNSTPSPPSDGLTLLSHKLIRTACQDDFDPFMIGTPPDQDGPIVRACFYFAVVVTPKHTVVFDNQGRGGMCDLSPEEMVAVWDTAPLLASQGMSMETLHVPLPELPDVPVPSPLEIANDLPSFDPDAPPAKARLDDFPVAPQFAGRVHLTDLLKRDVELLCFLVEQGWGARPDQEQEPEPPASVSRRPKMG